MDAVPRGTGRQDRAGRLPRRTARAGGGNPTPEPSPPRPRPALGHAARHQRHSAALPGRLRGGTRPPARGHRHLHCRAAPAGLAGRRRASTGGRRSPGRDEGDECESPGVNAMERENGIHRVSARLAGRRRASTGGRRSPGRDEGDECESPGFNAMEREDGSAWRGPRGWADDAKPSREWPACAGHDGGGRR